MEPALCHALISLFAVVLQSHALYVYLPLLTCVPPLSFSQAWRDLTRTGESRAGDVNVDCVQLSMFRHELSLISQNTIV